MNTLLIALTLLIPPPLQDIVTGTTHKTVNCLYRGNRSVCTYIEKDKTPYLLVSRKDEDNLHLLYVVTIRDGKPLEIWSFNQRET